MRNLCSAQSTLERHFFQAPGEIWREHKESIIAFGWKRHPLLLSSNILQHALQSDLSHAGKRFPIIEDPATS